MALSKKRVSKDLHLWVFLVVALASAGSLVWMGLGGGNVVGYLPSEFPSQLLQNIPGNLNMGKCTSSIKYDKICYVTIAEDGMYDVEMAYIGTESPLSFHINDRYLRGYTQNLIILGPATYKSITRVFLPKGTYELQMKHGSISFSSLDFSKSASSYVECRIPLYSGYDFNSLGSGGTSKDACLSSYALSDINNDALLEQDLASFRNNINDISSSVEGSTLICRIPCNIPGSNKIKKCAGFYPINLNYPFSSANPVCPEAPPFNMPECIKTCTTPKIDECSSLCGEGMTKKILKCNANCLKLGTKTCKGECKQKESSGGVTSPPKEDACSLCDKYFYDCRAGCSKTYVSGGSQLTECQNRCSDEAKMCDVDCKKK